MHWLQKYAQRCDGKYCFWDEYAFTTDQPSACDAVLIFNTPYEKIRVQCYNENVLAFMMEPGVFNLHPWMFKGLAQYSKVFSPVKNSPNTVQSPGFLGWHLLQDHNHLSAMAVPAKTKSISCIVSSATQLEGQRKRLAFADALQCSLPGIDFYGKGKNYIPDKSEGLLPYRYSIAMENTSMPYYFTEKITDCFLSYTVPVYFGCTNIGDFFPQNSFIQIDINDYASAVKKLETFMKNDDWELRLPALAEARNRVLNYYQPLAAAASLLRKQVTTEKQQVALTPILPNLIQKLKNRFMLSR